MMIMLSTTTISTTTIKLSPLFLAQEVPPFEQIISSLGEDLGTSVFTFVKAILILVIGWIVANWSKGFVKKQLDKTEIDNKIANWITGGQAGQKIPIEQFISGVIYWIIILFTIVAFLSSLQLDAVSVPLNALLEQITSFLPQVFAAALLLALAWLIATIVKLVVTRGLNALGIDDRFNQQVSESYTETSGEGEQKQQLGISETIANALYWFIYLLFLPSILSTLELEGTLRPVQELVNEVLSIIPNVFAAILIGAVGWLIAQIVRKIVTSFLTATGVNNIGAKFGLSEARGSKSLPWIIGTIVYILILIPAAIASLNALEIRAISEPAIAMLNQVLNILPKIFAASVVWIIAYIAGKYISELVIEILTGIGFNKLYKWLGIETSSSQTPSETPSETPAEGTSLQELPTDSTPDRTPSEIVGIIVWVAILAIATLTAVDILEIEALQNLVGNFLVLAGQVLIGLIVFGIGLFLSNKAFDLISSSDTRQSMFLAQTARIAIMILITAMALQQMGIATNIVNLAFGLLTGGISVAIALAFGLGGREVASEQLRKWIDSFKDD